MMKKKILASALACALVLSTATVASAAEISAPDSTTGAYAATLEGGATVNVPTIKITVPDDLTVVINPYKLDYDIDSVTYNDQLVNAEQEISNESDVAIDVSATVKAAPSQDVTIATAELKGTEKTKSVFSYLEVTSTAGTYAGKYDSKAASQIAFTTKETTKANIAQVPDTGKVYYKIIGSVATKPDKAWADADTITYSIAYNFAPVVKGA